MKKDRDLRERGGTMRGRVARFKKSQKDKLGHKQFQKGQFLKK